MHERVAQKEDENLQYDQTYWLNMARSISRQTNLVAKWWVLLHIVEATDPALAATRNALPC